MRNSATASLEEHIRFALKPDEPRLLSTYLDLCDEVVGEAPGRIKRYFYRRAYSVLIAAIEDETNPMHWRWLCLDNIYRTLQGLQRLARSAEDVREVQSCSFRMQQLSEVLMQRARPEQHKSDSTKQGDL
ncbi:MAG: FagA protein [Pseudomonadota bacterium]